MNWQAKSTQQLTMPTSWQQLQQGEAYCNSLSRHFSSWANKIFGQQALYIGGLSAELNTPIQLPYSFVISPETSQNLTALALEKQFSLIETDLSELPFMSQSINFCMAINSLNFSQDPHQLLREIQRVLTDDGYLFLALFNPFSPLLFKQNLAAENQPKLIFRQFLTWRIIDWLQLLNFQILQQQNIAFSWNSGCFSPLTTIVARKQTYPLILQPQKSLFDAEILLPSNPLPAYSKLKSKT